jgi:hypothetical protein
VPNEGIDLGTVADIITQKEHNGFCRLGMEQRFKSLQKRGRSFCWFPEFVVDVHITVVFAVKCKNVVVPTPVGEVSFETYIFLFVYPRWMRHLVVDPD